MNIICDKLRYYEINALDRYICRWWKDLDIANKFPYAKDRFVESYSCTIGMYFEAQHSRLRRMQTKVVNMNSLIDDTYDAYGTRDELLLLTNAIQR